MSEGQPQERVKRVVKAISLESLVSGSRAYYETFKKVIRSPRRFASRELLPWQPGMLQSATSIYLYGVAISFLIYLPFLQWHGSKLTKLHFLLQFIYSQLLLVCLVHLSARVVRGRGTFIQTTTAYCIWSGITVPIMMALFCPVFFYRTPEDFINASNYGPSVPSWVAWWVVALLVGCFPLVGLTLFQWIADTHRIAWRRLLIGLILVYCPLILIHNYFLAPFIGGWLRRTSNLLQRLL